MAKKGFKSLSVSESCDALILALGEKLSQEHPGSTWSKSQVVEISVKEKIERMKGGEGVTE